MTMLPWLKRLNLFGHGPLIALLLLCVILSLLTGRFPLVQARCSKLCP